MQLLQNKLTQHIQESLQVRAGPFPDFQVGPWDEVTLEFTDHNEKKNPVKQKSRLL